MPFEPSPDIPVSGEDRGFIDEQVNRGRFKTRGEVVHEGLRMLKDWEDLLGRERDRIRTMIDQGMQSAARGEFIDGEEFFAEWRRRDEQARSGLKKPA